MKYLALLNRALDALEKNTKRNITVATIPSVQQAFETQLKEIQAARVEINQKDFFK